MLYLRRLLSHLSSIFMASSCEAQNGLLAKRLTQIKGDGDKVNDVFVYGKQTGCKEHIIFFGGDVQDYPENMEKHRDNKKYLEWNTEKTAAKIHKKFPDSLVFSIKATRMHLMTFAVYSNFIEVNDFGSPTHSTDYGALKHLASLYSSLCKEVLEPNESSNSTVPVTLVAFSKGCTVLNQLVFELPTIKDTDPSVDHFIEKVKSFYWLDGGHSGGTENTWVTDDAALRHLANLQCDIHIHVTPYQVRDPMRKWIGQQQSKFYKKLKGFGAKVVAIEHFDVEPPSLDNHFQLLEEF